jgi:hypothetical protein
MTSSWPFTTPATKDAREELDGSQSVRTRLTFEDVIAQWFLCPVPTNVFTPMNELCEDPCAEAATRSDEDPADPRHRILVVEDDCDLHPLNGPGDAFIATIKIYSLKCGRADSTRNPAWLDDAIIRCRERVY